MMQEKRHTCEEALKKLNIKSEITKTNDTTKDNGSDGQRPYAAILSCADSRIIPENIFPVSEGELFVTRVAGNIANPATVASLEYAVAVLEVPVIIVLGHEKCGAVESAIKQYVDRIDFGYNLNQLLSYITPAINCPGETDSKKKENHCQPATSSDLKKSIERNVLNSVQQLTERSIILKQFVEEKKLLIIGGYTEFDGDVEAIKWLTGHTCPV